MRPFLLRLRGFADELHRSATKFTGALTELANVNPNGFWEGALEDVSVDGTSLGLAGRTAILDTVRSLWILRSSC